MIQNTIHTRVSRAELRQAIARISQAARGMYGAKPLADAMLTRCAMALLGRVKKAFIAKARGGTDEAGERWAPLSPKTIAYSWRHPGLPKAKQRASKAPSYALKTKQRERWWEVYRRNLARFRGDKGAAARVAWAVLKSEGAETLMSKYGGTQVEILRDTGLLLNSLSPGVESAERVLRLGRGEVIVGTNRKWAKQHHQGVPGKIPQRRLWPKPSKWPANWWKDIGEQAKQGIVDIVTHLIRSSIR